MPAAMKSRKTKRSPNTPDRILDVAQELTQTRGYNGFSYADVAAKIGLTKASLHHHFATKAALGAALIERYTARVAQALEEIDATGKDAPERLARFTQIYADVLRQDRLCLCAMLAAEFGTLSPAIQKAVRQFFKSAHAWLQKVIADGRAAGSLAPQGSDAEAARVLLSGLEGAMLIARPLRDNENFYTTSRSLLANLQRR